MNDRKKAKLYTFLTERGVRVKAARVPELGLQRVDKIDFTGRIHLSERPTNTDMILVKQGDLLISGINAAKGAVSVYKGDADVLASIHYSSYRLDQDLINVDYLRAFLRSDAFEKLLRASTNGGIKTELRAKHLLPLEIELPPLDEQAAIANAIEVHQKELDELDVDLTHQATLLTRLRQAILREAVQGRLVPQDATDEPAPVLLARIRAEKQRLVKEKKLRADKPLPPLSKRETSYEVPKGWAWCSFGELGSITGGGTPQKDRSEYWGGAIPWVTPKDMKTPTINQSIDTLTTEGVAASSAKLLEIDSVLIVVRGMILNRIIPVATNTVPVTINQDMKALLPFIRETTPYIFLCMEALESTILKMIEKSTHGTGKLESSKLYSLPIPLPPLPEQHRIVSKVTELLAYCTELEAELGRARQAAESLHAAALREAFKGPVGAMIKMEL